MSQIADTVQRMGSAGPDGGPPESSDWDELSAQFSELTRLVGDTTPRNARWQDFARHLRFREPQDYHDIATLDWPSVRAEVERSLYSEDEPIPVELTDLGELVSARPSGPVTTQLSWHNLSDDEFERLVFQLVYETDAYENVTWLMKTNAPDRGRDIQALRTVKDPLSGTETTRVIIQCKHWLSRSVGRSDLVEMLESVRLWEPPIVDSLIVATTGRFSQDAVALSEMWQRERRVPRPILWAESHLETLLSTRPHLIGQFRLR